MLSFDLTEGAPMKDEAFYNRVSGDRISSRQIDELIGISRGLAADGQVNQAEAEFLQKWLAANLGISDQPVIRTLYDRVTAMLQDGTLNAEESRDLLDTLNQFCDRDFELGEVLKSTSLPLCNPAPVMSFEDKTYCFTGTFNFGQRKYCEEAVIERGGICGSLTKNTNFLVIGLYATESWKHSSFGNKIIKACDLRESGLPIAIVSEEHWVTHL